MGGTGLFFEKWGLVSIWTLELLSDPPSSPGFPTLITGGGDPSSGSPGSGDYQSGSRLPRSG